MVQNHHWIWQLVCRVNSSSDDGVFGLVICCCMHSLGRPIRAQSWPPLKYSIKLFLSDDTLQIYTFSLWNSRLRESHFVFFDSMLSCNTPCSEEDIRIQPLNGLLIRIKYFNGILLLRFWRAHIQGVWRASFKIEKSIFSWFCRRIFRRYTSGSQNLYTTMKD
jgi:hypothetical protein